MAESTEASILSTQIPLLPNEIIELIISHCVEPYSLKIAYSWWNFKRRIRIYNIPRLEPLELVSHAFNDAVKHQVRRGFTGQLTIDYDAAVKMQHFRRSRSTLVNWLFDHTTTLMVHDFEMDFERDYYLGLKHWPALRYLKLMTTNKFCEPETKDPEFVRIFAGEVFENLHLRNTPSMLRIFLVTSNWDKIALIEKTGDGAVFRDTFN